MRILKARYQSGEDMMAHDLAGFRHGGLFFPTRGSVPIGEAVLLDVVWPELPGHVVLRCVVAWRRPVRPGQVAGLGLELKATERAKREFLLRAARGELVGAVVRRHPRLPLELPVDFRPHTARAARPALLGDIAAGGAFLRTAEAIPVGTPVVISLLPPGSAAPVALEARVCWSQTAPGDEGLGVEFRCRDLGGLRRLRELVRRIQA